MDFEDRIRLVDEDLARRIVAINAAAADEIVAATRVAVAERDKLLRHQIASEIARPNRDGPARVTRSDEGTEQGVREQAPASPGGDASATATEKANDEETAGDFVMRILRAVGTAMPSRTMDAAAERAGKTRAACEKARQRLKNKGAISLTPEGWVVARSSE